MIARITEQLSIPSAPVVERASAATSPVASEPTVWGFNALQLHDAYWRSKGVQCIRCGQPQKLQRAAEMFLLLQAHQLVQFDIAALSERLTWRDAAVTRLRLRRELPQVYAEKIVLDEDGCVERIERRYRSASVASCRVLMTSVHRIAKAWMNAKNLREARDKVRRLSIWTRVDRVQSQGQWYCSTDAKEQSQFLTELVLRWPYPNQAIAGLEEIEPGVWHLAGEPVERSLLRIGPLWLGSGAGRKEQVLIGPAWHGDVVVDEPARRVTLIDIPDIEPRQAAAVVPLRHQQHSPNYLLAKRAMDIAISALALIFGFPIMLAVAVCILLDDGRPLFFGHVRQGLGGRPFRCWKFRTMRRDAHKIARQFQDQNICDGPQVFIKNDPRVTRVGRILRKTNLDELPQFWNVLMGHMSLVGPRPSPDDENQYCPAWRDLRLSVRPGITGLWQLNRTRGRGIDFQEWIRYDTQYVQNASIWLDLNIMFRTAMMLALGKRRKKIHDD